MSANQSKTDQAIDSILAYITSHGLGVGDKLPSEDEWVQQLGVSRLCVREALVSLKFLGILHSGTRGGSRLQPVDFGLLSRMLSFQIALGGVSMQQLMEARLSIEMYACELLCGHLQDADYKELKELAKAPSIYSHDVHVQAKGDCEFHRKLVTGTGNAILSSFSQLLNILFEHLAATPAMKTKQPDSYYERIADDHDCIVECLRCGNLDLVRGMLKKHLGGYTAEANT